MTFDVDGHVHVIDGNNDTDGSILENTQPDSSDVNMESGDAEDAKRAHLEHVATLQQQLSAFMIPWAPATATTVLDFSLCFSQTQMPRR